MDNHESLSLDELEDLCDRGMVDFFRNHYHDDPQAYRAAILGFLNRPQMPVGGMLRAIRGGGSPTDTWQAVLAACRAKAVNAPWDRLPEVDIERDIEEAQVWLATQLLRDVDATGVYLGLDTLNMRGGSSANLEFRGSSECNPESDSCDWLEGSLTQGDQHLIRGLYELHMEYSQPAWRKHDEAVCGGSYFAFADYTLFLGYSGVILAQALLRLPTNRSLFVLWGFHDGDLFPLGRMTQGKCELLCSM